MTEGCCLCGAVRYTVAAPFGQATACHCSQCRRQSGHYWAAADVPRAALTVTGEDALRWYHASPKGPPRLLRHLRLLPVLGSGREGHDRRSPSAPSPAPPAPGSHATSSSPTRATTTTSPTACRRTREVPAREPKIPVVIPVATRIACACCGRKSEPGSAHHPREENHGQTQFPEVDRRRSARWSRRGPAFAAGQDHHPRLGAEPRLPVLRPHAQPDQGRGRGRGRRT